MFFTVEVEGAASLQQIAKSNKSAVRVCVCVCVAAHFCSKVLGHAGLLDEGSPGFLQTGSVVREQPRSLNLCGDVGYLVLHPLKEHRCKINISEIQSTPTMMLQQARKSFLKPT